MLGTMSIILSLEGNFYGAAVAILVAMVFDGMDGWIAKMMNATSTFGEKLDSLADVVSFGLAPAMMLYGSVFRELGVFGGVFAVLLPISGAIRLALFNPKLSAGYFIGLPITATGGIIAALVVSGVYFPLAVWSIVVLVLTTLMVSHVRYPDIKRINLRYSRLWEILTCIGLVSAAAFINPRHLFFWPFTVYIVYGFKNWALARVRVKETN